MGTKDILLALLFSSAAEALGSNFEEDLICADYARHIHAYNPTHLYNPPNPRGDWSSIRCETVPGPQFIIRHFTFHLNSWIGRFYHYEDGACTNPRFTVTVSGRLIINSTMLHLSTSTFGCYLGFDKMWLAVQEQTVAAEVEDLLNKKCPGSVKDASSNSWLLSHQARERKRCREYLGLHPSSYSRLMMVGHKRSSHIHDLLLFGDLPPTNARRNFQPRSFQLELVRIDRPDCQVCKLIKANAKGVPILPTPVTSLPGLFTGTWVTEACKSYQDAHDTGGMSFFRTHLLKFFQSKDEHSGLFLSEDYYFSDVDCRSLNFVLKGGGQYRNISRSQVVDETINLNFDVQWMLMTVYESFTLAALKTSEGDCGQASSWKEGVEQNITATGGCAYFGISVPFTIPSLLKVEKGKTQGLEELYLSEPDNQGVLSNQRPTHLSKILKTCTEIATNRTSMFDVPTTHAPQPVTFAPVNMVNPEIVLDKSSNAKSSAGRLLPVRWLVALYLLFTKKF